MTPDVGKHDAPEHIDRPALSVMRDWTNAGQRCVLLTIVDIDGRSPRSIGAQMVVSDSGDMHGYLTGGCLEGELCLVGQQVIKDGQNKLIRYGKDSAFIDIKLPCGSGVDIYFDQSLSLETVRSAASLLANRRYFALRTDLKNGQSSVLELDTQDWQRQQIGAKDDVFERLFKPALQLNLYGAGSAALQIAHFAAQAGIGVNFYCADKLTRMEALRRGFEPLDLPSSDLSADRWTASLLAFHEHEKEIPLLPHLLKGEGFYIGAIGSRKVADQRTADMKKEGMAQEEIDRLIQYPGLIPGARSATELGLGIVADILDHARRDGMAS